MKLKTTGAASRLEVAPHTRPQPKASLAVPGEFLGKPLPLGELNFVLACAPGTRLLGARGMRGRPGQSHEVVLAPGFPGNPAYFSQSLLGNKHFEIAIHVGLRATMGGNLFRGLPE